MRRRLNLFLRDTIGHIVNLSSYVFPIDSKANIFLINFSKCVPEDLLRLMKTLHVLVDIPWYIRTEQKCYIVYVIVVPWVVRMYVEIIHEL